MFIAADLNSHVRSPTSATYQRCGGFSNRYILLSSLACKTKTSVSVTSEAILHGGRELYNQIIDLFSLYTIKDNSDHCRRHRLGSTAVNSTPRRHGELS